MCLCYDDYTVKVETLVVHLEVSGVQWVVKHIIAQVDSETLDMIDMFRDAAAKDVRAPRAGVVLPYQVAGAETYVILDDLQTAEVECLQILRAAANQQSQSLHL